jgi:hypothetical protein
MRTAYLTFDEVNARQAIRLGRRCGQTVYLVSLRSPGLGGEPFLVIDLDYVPASEHARLFKLLLPRPAGRLAVHGYNLSADTVRRLTRAGVIVRCRLDAPLFRQLRGGPPVTRARARRQHGSARATPGPRPDAP